VGALRVSNAHHPAGLSAIGKEAFDGIGEIPLWNMPTEGAGKLRPTLYLHRLMQWPTRSNTYKASNISTHPTDGP
jgi:hypothetical protein